MGDNHRNPRQSSRPGPSDSLLFSPITLNQLTLQNRVWLPAMVTWLGNDEGIVTEDIAERYLRYALGESGMIVFEATGIHEVSSGPLLRLSHDRFIPDLKDLVRKMHDSSPSKVAVQLIHFLKVAARNPHKYLTHVARQNPHLNLENKSETELQQILSPRQWQEYNYGYRQLISDLSVQEVREIPLLFAAAAGRAREAGFDSVELHFAHAYTMASFLSRTNPRTDQYGGETPENRVRLALEVIEAVRREVGEDYALGCRFLGREDIEGGSEVGEGVYFASEFARAGLDFLSLSRGGKFDDAKKPRIGEVVYPYTGHSGEMCMPSHRYPAAHNHFLAAQIKKSLVKAGLRIPVVTCGRIQTFELAEQILQTGEADLIGMARQLLADPDWPKKTRDGSGRIVYCDYHNVCEALDRNHLPVRCKLWMNTPKGTMHAPVSDYSSDRSSEPVPD